MAGIVASPALEESPSVAVAGRLCPACGYALEGLPNSGSCPECGRSYSDAVVVLYGFGRGSHASTVTCRPRSLIAFGLLVALNFGPTLLVQPGDLWMVALVVVMTVGLATWVRRHSSHPGTVQARFNSRGCVQHPNRVDPTVQLVAFLGTLGIFGCVGLFWLAGASRRGWRHSDSIVLIVLGAIMLVVLAVGVWQVRRERAIAVRCGLLNGLTDDLHPTLPVAWGVTAPMTIASAGPNRFRLTIRLDRPMSGAPVDIEIEAPRERVDAMVEQIRTLRSAGTATDGARLRTLNQVRSSASRRTRCARWMDGIRIRGSEQG